MRRFAGMILALLVASPASAQSFTYEGRLGSSATDMLGGQGIGFLDVTFGLPLSRRVPLSFEFGTYLFALDGKRPHETYGALVWKDRVKLGALRPAYDAVLPSVFETRAPYLAYARAEYARSHNTVEAMRRTAVPWGLSVEGSTERVDWIVSVHDAIEGTFRSASVAVTYKLDTLSLMAAVEGVWSRDNGPLGMNAKLGATFDLGPLSAGLSLVHPDANDRPNILAVDLRMPVAPRFDMSLMGEFTQDGSDDAYGLAFDHAAGPDSTVIFSATDGAAGPALHLTYAHRF